MRRAAFIFLVSLAVPGTCGGETGEYRLIESVAASVNGEVIFLSDVAREACFHRCGMFPGQASQEITLSRARETLIADVMVLQEQRKLGLGGADNAALAETAGKAVSRKTECTSPCAAALSDAEIRDFVERRILVKDFLEKRVAVFIEVNDEEVRREIVNRTRVGTGPEEIREEKVRKDLFEEKTASGVRSWFVRATSRSRIVLSPLGEP